MRPCQHTLLWSLAKPRACKGPWSLNAISSPVNSSLSTSKDISGKGRKRKSSPLSSELQTAPFHSALHNPCRLPSPRPRVEKCGLLAQQPLGGPGLWPDQTSQHLLNTLHFPALLGYVYWKPYCPSRAGLLCLPSRTFQGGFLLCPVPLPRPADPWSLVRLVCSSHRGLWVCSSPEQRAHVGGLWPSIIYLSVLLWQQSIVVTWS